jgi:hypothetical protein
LRDIEFRAKPEALIVSDSQTAKVPDSEQAVTDIRSQQFVIFGVAFSAIVGNAMTSGGYDFWDTVVGLILGAVLLMTCPHV